MPTVTIHHVVTVAVLRYLPTEINVDRSRYMIGIFRLLYYSLFTNLFKNHLFTHIMYVHVRCSVRHQIETILLKQLNATDRVCTCVVRISNFPDLEIM